MIPKIVGVTDLQRRFRSVFDDVVRHRTAYVLTRGSRPEAAMIPYEDFLQFQALQERQVLARFDQLVERMRRQNAAFDDEEVAADVERARESEKSIRAVVDANVLVRAVIKPDGTVGPVLSELRSGHYVLLWSQALLSEVVDVLNRPRIRVKYGLSQDDMEAVLALLILRGEPVEPTERIAVCRDPKDDKVLELALAGEAGVIVSGDDDLLVLHPFRGIPIVGPTRFLAMLDA